MLYIITEYDELFDSTTNKTIFDVDDDIDVQVCYSNFLAEKAKIEGIIINQHWHNIMNHEDYHKNLTEKEYKSKKNIWNNFIKHWTIERYIKEVLKGRKLKFIELW